MPVVVGPGSENIRSANFLALCQANKSRNNGGSKAALVPMAIENSFIIRTRDSGRYPKAFGASEYSSWLIQEVRILGVRQLSRTLSSEQKPEHGRVEGCVGLHDDGEQR